MGYEVENGVSWWVLSECGDLCINFRMRALWGASKEAVKVSASIR